MNLKNIILTILIISGGALFLVLQKYSNNDYFSFDQPQAPAAIAPGSRYSAPDFTLTDLDKKDVQLSGSRGNVVAMIFWTTW